MIGGVVPEEPSKGAALSSRDPHMCQGASWGVRTVGDLWKELAVRGGWGRQGHEMWRQRFHLCLRKEIPACSRAGGSDSAEREERMTQEGGPSCRR